MYICRGNNLVTLNLFNNKLISTPPPSLANYNSIIRVHIESNNFICSIPQALPMLPNLTFLYFSNNNFRGKIPRELGNLQYLNISGNSFRSALPKNLWKAINLCGSSQLLFPKSRVKFQVFWMKNDVQDPIAWKFHQMTYSFQY